jgi:hypothetical protein
MFTLLLAFFLYILSGWALLSLLRKSSFHGPAKNLCLSADLNIPLHTTWFLIIFRLKITLDPSLVWGPCSAAAVLSWIRQNKSEGSHFSINGFVIGQGQMANGLDTLWWLSYVALWRRKSPGLALRT